MIFTEEKTSEKVMAELKNALITQEKPSLFFENLRKNNSLDEWYPELKALIGVPQNANYHQEGDVWKHTMMVLDEAAKRQGIAVNPFGFMLSALCHDFGKAVCTEKINGVVHAYAHEAEGLPIAEKFLDRLGADKQIKAYVLNMVELHMEPNIMAGSRSKLKSTNKLFDSAVEPFDLIQLSICDGLGKIPQNKDSEPFLMDRYNRFLEIMARPFVTENDLIAAGIEDEKISEVLKYAHKLRLAGVEKDNALRQCIPYARKVLKGADESEA